MKEDLISIIIPVYNVEKYLKKCINSVLNQTYKNIQIILVDDGSSDNSGIICDEYERKDKRIKTIHKNNGGLSDARNAGIEKAEGKYITFVDSDDYIENDYITYLHALIKKYNCKMSICSYYIEMPDGKRNDIGRLYQEKLMMKEECLSRMLCDEGFSVSACGKMYDMQLFEDVRYPIGKLCEDNGTTYKLIKKCSTIAYGNNSKYIYFKHEGSIMNSKFNPQKLDLIELTDKMAEELKNEYPRIKDSIERRIIYVRFSVLRQLISDKEYDKKLARSLKREILKKWKEIFFNNKINSRDRIAFLTLLFGINFFRFAWNFYCKIMY